MRTLLLATLVLGGCSSLSGPNGFAVRDAWAVRCLSDSEEWWSVVIGSTGQCAEAQQPGDFSDCESLEQAYSSEEVCDTSRLVASGGVRTLAGWGRGFGSVDGLSVVNPVLFECSEGGIESERLDGQIRVLDPDWDHDVATLDVDAVGISGTTSALLCDSTPEDPLPDDSRRRGAPDQQQKDSLPE